MEHRAIIGREVPLRTLDEALAAPPRVVLVSGEAGIGKTRLVAEAEAGYQKLKELREVHANRDIQAMERDLMSKLGPGVAARR